MLQRERRHFECVQNSECKREVAICVYEISVCAATRKKRKCVSRRPPQPKNVPQKTKEGNNKDASATTQHSGQRCRVKDPLTFACCSASNIMSNACRTASAREKSRQVMPTTIAGRRLKRGQRSQSLQVAKLVSTSGFVLQPSTSGRRPPASGLRPPVLR